MQQNGRVMVEQAEEFVKMDHIRAQGMERVWNKVVSVRLGARTSGNCKEYKARKVHHTRTEL